MVIHLLFQDDYVKFAPPNSNPKKEKKAKAEPIAAAAAVSAAGATVSLYHLGFASVKSARMKKIV